MRNVIAFISGLFFASGLVVGGMTQPKKIVDFLDVTGNWDPSLAFVMGGALLVNAVAYRWVQSQSQPFFDSDFYIPQRSDLDWKLIGGAALFGIGWGLGGYCPGPALTAVVSAQTSVLGFVGGMIGGVLLYKGFDRIALSN